MHSRDGDVLDEVQGEEDDNEPDAKRRRIEGGTGNTGSEDDDDEQASQPPPQRQQPSAPPPIATGLLSADTLEGLKYFSEIRKRTAGTSTQQRAPPRPSTAGLGLAAYGSDSEED